MTVKFLLLWLTNVYFDGTDNQQFYWPENFNKQADRDLLEQQQEKSL